eukprot:Nitzschia sp. Nitz4//scaffold197_size40390//12126//13655//NITZ4_007513-RA/size40390-snap-gene-0.47-mRNA-1//-1//CDS//3329540472//2379//frame0
MRSTLAHSDRPVHLDVSTIMASMRRLSDNDVRSIFESLHGNHPPPPQLKFQIVPVGPHGQKLSPPSFEFEDGLYVLVRPEKKRKNMSSSALAAVNQAKIPRHLKHLVMESLPPETCPWSLSGPQFPQPTAIQQRYCYPKGNPEYSGRKGGALWTMYGRDGKEDLEFRLLHVYFSAKRAVNKGVALSEEDRQKQFIQQEAAAMTPKRKRLRLSRMERSPWQEDHDSVSSRGGLVSSARSPPCIQRSSTTRSTTLPSPSSVHHLPQRDQRPRQVGSTSIFITPNTAATSPAQTKNEGAKTSNWFDHPPFHPVLSFDVDESEEAKGGADGSKKKGVPFRKETREKSTTGQSWQPSILHCGSGGEFLNQDSDFVFRGTTVSDENNGTLAGGALESLFWSDPLLNLTDKASFESKNSLSDRSAEEVSSGASLLRRLDDLQERIRTGILSHSPSEQGKLVSIVAQWARGLASSPLRRKKKVVDVAVASV